MILSASLISFLDFPNLNKVSAPDHPNHASKVADIKQNDHQL